MNAKTKKRTRKQILADVGRLQDLIGRAKSAYLNDRDLNRATKVIESLEEAFELCLEIRSEGAP